MSSRCLDLLLAAMLWAALPATGRAADETAQPSALRACVDPDNLPYSQQDGRGYEPALARLLAHELKLPLQLQWQPMRRGFVRKTLGAGECDVLLSVPAGLDRVLTTRPYYRAGQVLLTRAGDSQPLRSFDDPRLPRLAIGVQLVGDDGASSPPGQVLAQRGAARVVGFTVDGGSQPGRGPAVERMVQALQRGEIDAAMAWGPQAGWFAAQARPRLRVQALLAPPDARAPFEFGIALAVRPGERAWRDRLQEALDARREEVDALLAQWAVPRVDKAPAHAEDMR